MGESVSSELARSWRRVERAPAGVELPSPRVRGQTFRTLLAAVGSLGVSVERVVEELPADLARLLRQDLLTAAWYPLTSFVALHEAVQRVAGPSPQLARELGRVAARLDARGAFQFVLRFTSPELLVRHSGRVLGLYIEGTELSIKMMGPGLARFRFTRAHGYTEWVWQGHYGTMEELVLLAGGEGPRVVELDRGDDFALGELSWG